MRTTGLRNGLLGIGGIFSITLLLKTAYDKIDPNLSWKPSIFMNDDAESFCRVSPAAPSLPNMRSGLVEIGFPQTDVIRHVPGFTIFDNLFMLNGTLFIVSDKPDDLPEIRMMTSTGYPLYHGEEEIRRREPTPHDMQIISSKAALELFGHTVTRLSGVTFLVNDPSQFATHYYHFVAEVLLSLWRAYTTLDLAITTTGQTSLPPPQRFIFPHIPYGEWSDGPGLDQYVVRSAFPSVAIEYEDDWLDRSATLRPFKYDRVVLADRAAAARCCGGDSAARYGTPVLTLPASQHWWAPIRNAVMDFSRLDRSKPADRPVITYISRQKTGHRMLKPADHEKLVKALRKLEKKGYEVIIANMESMTKEEQMRLTGRSNIIMGVHGNGLTSLIWMQPTPRTAVFEFFYPKGFTFDYQWTAHALNITHYGFWDSHYFTAPQLPPISYPEGFQGNEIPIDGDSVAALCEKILSGGI
ncbi:hypothetical protein FRC03_002932 [Tulasnella sp. 419]|nr:hypothetical protein FRC03_002932 [Tulasnella sp. 419]